MTKLKQTLHIDKTLRMDPICNKRWQIRQPLTRRVRSSCNTDRSPNTSFQHVDIVPPATWNEQHVSWMNFDIQIFRFRKQRKLLSLSVRHCWWIAVELWKSSPILLQLQTTVLWVEHIRLIGGPKSNSFASFKLVQQWQRVVVVMQQCLGARRTDPAYRLDPISPNEITRHPFHFKHSDDRPGQLGQECRRFRCMVPCGWKPQYVLPQSRAFVKQSLVVFEVILAQMCHLCIVVGRGFFFNLGDVRCVFLER